MRKVVLVAAAVFVTVVFVSQTRAEADRHFRARLDLTEAGPPVADARCPAGTVLILLTGSGNVTRAGRVSAEGSHCTVDDPAVEPFTDGQMTLSSRRGDLFIEYEGNDAAGELSGTFVMTGGTGDFAGATGGGVLNGTADGLGGGSVTLEGTISVP